MTLSYAVPLAALTLAAVSLANAAAQTSTLISELTGPVRAVTLADGLEHPWGMALLPDGQLLLTERSGALRVYGADSTLGERIGGVPEVWAQGQGGLLDVAIDPDFGTPDNRFVYLTYSEAGDGGTAGTAFGRGRLSPKLDRLDDFEVLFRMHPKVEGPNHFGSRIVFAGDSLVFVTLAERFKFDPAQNPDDHLGTVVRLLRDGSVPADNPVVGEPDVAPEVYSYGHRNVQGAAVDPATGAIWVAEFGPLGGDEFNRLEPGANYGWPLVSWGRDYDGTDRPDPPTRPEFADAAVHWTPTISPSGMIFYTGDMFPRLEGAALISGLTAMGLVAVRTVSPGVAEEVGRLPLESRVRDVEQAPDGSLFVLTDDREGRLLRLSRMTSGARE